jgi:hypothetical protein
MHEIISFEKRGIPVTGIRILQEDMTEFLELVPPYKFFQIVMDYLAYDPQVQEFVYYIQSEEFLPIHKVVEYLKQYKNVSAFMCMFL